MPQKHILLVDIDKNMLHALEFILEANDFKVTTTHDSKQAMALILDSLEKEEPFDALVTDLQMPNLSAMELLNEICRYNIDIPKVAIATEKCVKNELQHINKIECLEKPFNDDELIKRILKIIG